MIQNKFLSEPSSRCNALLLGGRYTYITVGNNWVVCECVCVCTTGGILVARNVCAKNRDNGQEKRKNQNIRRHFFPALCHRRIVSPGRPSPLRRGRCLIGAYTVRACVYEAPTGSLLCPSSVFVASIRYTVVFSWWLSTAIYHFIGYTCNASNTREHCSLSFNIVTPHLFLRDARASVIIIIFIIIKKGKRGKTGIS